MRIFADLHVHSKYSRAVSKDMELPNIDAWAKKKGIGLMGTGDFTHPAWFAHLQSELQEDGSGILHLKSDPTGTAFVLACEISCIYTRAGKGHRMHIIVLCPDIATVTKLNQKLATIGNVKSDGRPILGLDAEELLKIALDINPKNILIPAHAWTPWFSLFGSASGFDSLEEAFGSQAKHIFAIETGLSSDPAMNWRLSQLDRIAITSYSDAHSPKPTKMGREATEFELASLTYDNLAEALKSQGMILDGLAPKNTIISTIEFFPEEGKYHWDGHRDHKIRWSPAETKKHNGVCPVCGRQVTIGVEARVQELADRPEGFKPSNRPPFHSLVPLEEIIGEALGVKPGTKKTTAAYIKITERHSEFDLLLHTSLEELQALTEPKIVEGIRRVREKQLTIEPGYDGVYGTVKIFSEAEKKSDGQASLFSI
jgi:uncharacterized protein (TIGR00375 family)